MITGRKLFELLAAHAAGGAYLDNSDEMDHAGVCIDGWFNLAPQERDAWWAAQGAAAKAAGVVFHRYSSHRVFREERREARERARTAGLSLMNKRTCPACGAEFDTCRLCGGRGWVCAG
jgi:hypothetical protein